MRRALWLVVACASGRTPETTCASPEEYFGWSRDALTLGAVRRNISSGAVAIVRDALPRATALALSAALLRDGSAWREVSKSDGAVSFRFARRALDDDDGALARAMDAARCATSTTTRERCATTRDAAGAARRTCARERIVERKCPGRCATRDDATSARSTTSNEECDDIERASDRDARDARRRTRD